MPWLHSFCITLSCLRVFAFNSDWNCLILIGLVASEIAATSTFKVKSKHFSLVTVSQIPQVRTRHLAHGYLSRYDPQRLENIRQTN